MYKKICSENIKKASCFTVYNNNYYVNPFAIFVFNEDTTITVYPWIGNTFTQEKSEKNETIVATDDKSTIVHVVENGVEFYKIKTTFMSLPIQYIFGKPFIIPENYIFEDIEVSFESGLKGTIIFRINDRDQIAYIINGSKSGAIIDYRTTQDLSQNVLNLTPDFFGLPTTPYSEQTGFQIAGKNATSLINCIDSINNLPIIELEQRMRPGQYSEAGFLGKTESLIHILTQDNDFVFSRGYTHQELAMALFYATYIVNRKDYLEKTSEIFKYANGLYNGNRTMFFGVQGSPFSDNTSSGTNYVINNLKTGKNIDFSGLLPEMIYRYGFYEGLGTSYRLSPQEIIDFFWG
jgi:hypothetical protein